MTRRRLPEDGRRRAVIERVEPEVEGGRFAAKRIRGQRVVVRADAFCDGHDELSCALRYRHEGETEWHEVGMQPLSNDRWEAAFEAAELGRYLYRPIAWVDRFKTWRHDLEKRLAAGQDVTQDLLVGAALVEEAAARAAGGDRKRLTRWAGLLREDAAGPEAPRRGANRSFGSAAKAPAGSTARTPAVAAAPPSPSPSPDHRALSAELDDLMARHPDRSQATEYHTELAVLVDRQRAGFSAWYELFPRSAADEPGRHGTFRDVEKLLPYVSDMGFDVLYLPPIHPIGRAKRKGPNNVPSASPDDPGSLWAIGSEEGGHKSIHPRLGTADDFRRLVRRADEEGLEIALDIALQCSPDHPYVREHPEWFLARPDGSIQYAENPPKKYEDIYPFDFETEAWQELWRELTSIFFHWIEQGVRIFRVDNPHTKPFAFWEWAIAEVKERHPEVIFLSEAFTRPQVMSRLAKVGFTQSYTYFTWRNGSWELRTYLEDLTTSPVSDFFRPNFWPNTPDILSEYLQTGGRGAFMTRLVLAATLSSCYGIYGPAFELRESQPRSPGSEEYLDSEKYQIRHWDLDRDDSLRGFIRRVNRIRQDNPALHTTDNLRFHRTDNEQLLAFSKLSADGANILLVVVNLDPHHVQSGWVDLAPQQLGLPPEGEFQVHDQLADQHFSWHGAWNYVELDPAVVPAHVFRVSRRVRSETDFEYYM